CNGIFPAVSRLSPQVAYRFVVPRFIRTIIVIVVGVLLGAVVPHIFLLGRYVCKGFGNDEFELVLVIPRVQAVCIFIMKGMMGEERTADFEKTICLPGFIGLDYLPCNGKVLGEGGGAGALFVHSVGYRAQVVDDIGIEGI